MPNRRTSGILLSLAIPAVLASSIGCSSRTVTQAALQQAVGPTFHRLYSLQQAQLGHGDATASPDLLAACTRAGATGTTGAGSWTCTVHYPFPDGHIEPLTYDVEVQPIGCYTATGPPAVVGQQRIRDTHGAQVTNALFAFDGCFPLS